MKLTLKILATLSAICFVVSRVTFAWNMVSLTFYAAFLIAFTAFVLCLVLLLIDKFL